MQETLPHLPFVPPNPPKNDSNQHTKNVKSMCSPQSQPQHEEDDHSLYRNCINKNAKTQI